MVLTLVSQPEYTIDTSSFAKCQFTPSSANRLALPAAVQYAQDRQSTLQSAREAVAFRLAASGADNADDYQITRTVALYLKDNDQFFVAFDDAPARNILLASAQEGCDAHAGAGTWRVKRSDPLITGAVLRAAKADRIVPVPLENAALRFSTTARNATSEYGASRLVRATIGDLAEPYAAFLNKKGYQNAYEWLLADLIHFGVDDDHVEVRRVVVGGDDDLGNMNMLYAGDRGYDGRARGVREQ